MSKLVIIESPYAGDVAGNVEYAKLCLLDSLKRGEAPIASHLLYPQVLNDLVPHERTMGIDAGLAWREVAELHVFYVDRGWSKGMIAAMDIVQKEKRSYDLRSLQKEKQNG